MKYARAGQTTVTALATPRRQRGIALVLVLWAAALLSVIATSFALSVRTEVRLTGSNTAGLRAGALAEAGIARAILGLSLDDSSVQWHGDGRVYTLVLGDGEVRVWALAETGKIDLNAASRELLTGLVHSALGALETPSDTNPEQIADAIMDWRDANDTKRLLGAEDRDYKQAGLAFEAGDRPFLAVGELRQVLGVSSKLYAAMAPLVTVFSANPRIDPVLAPRGVLLAVPGLTVDQVDEFVAEREAGFAAAVKTDSDLRALRRRLLLSARQMEPQVARYMASGRTAVYTLNAQSTVANGTLAVRQVTVRLGRSRHRPYQIMAWRESAMLPLGSVPVQTGDAPRDTAGAVAGHGSS